MFDQPAATIFFLTPACDRALWGLALIKKGCTGWYNPFKNHIGLITDHLAHPANFPGRSCYFYV